MQPFFESGSLRFSCTGCGKCCETAGDYYVYLTLKEAALIRDYLGLSHAWFRRGYLNRLEDGDLVLGPGRNERCVFLDQDGRCRVYPVRPLQCRTYPFWPEVAGNRRNWQREALRCEGIGNGPVVSRAVIRRAVRQCEEQFD
jgi:hypothetical protein